MLPQNRVLAIRRKLEQHLKQRKKRRNNSGEVPKGDPQEEEFHQGPLQMHLFYYIKQVNHSQVDSRQVEEETT